MQNIPFSFHFTLFTSTTMDLFEIILTITLTILLASIYSIFYSRIHLCGYTFTLSHDWFNLYFYTKNLRWLPLSIRDAIFGLGFYRPIAYYPRRTLPRPTRTYRSSYRRANKFNQPAPPSKKIRFEDDDTPSAPASTTTSITPATAPSASSSTLSALAPVFTPAASLTSTPSTKPEEPKTPEKTKKGSIEYFGFPDNHFSNNPDRSRSPISRPSEPVLDCSHCWKTHESSLCPLQLASLPAKHKNKKILLTQDQAYRLITILRDLPHDQDSYQAIQNQFKKILLKSAQPANKPQTPAAKPQTPATPSSSYILGALARTTAYQAQIKPLCQVSPLKPQDSSTSRTPKPVLSGSPIEAPFNPSPSRRNINHGCSSNGSANAE